MGLHGRQWDLAVTLWKILGFSNFCATQHKRESTESIAYTPSLKLRGINALNRTGSTAWDVLVKFWILHANLAFALHSVVMPRAWPWHPRVSSAGFGAAEANSWIPWP